uniref:No apical meristem-associated C-terminal domain-containing protein n=1 Tax=Setaria viridis TaxID=4556 RepID=A0A4U6T242_SETVI|nr:hypothetical protein SEVIR_9G374500v2 [Setaria viridis]
MAQSGLGRASNGAIIANEDWCRRHTEEMFHSVIVDGTSSTIPGCVNEDEDVAEDEEDLEDGSCIQNSPMSNSSRKRGSGTVDTASSPPKRSKSPFFKIFEGLIDTLQAGSSQGTSTLMKKEEIKMELRMKQRRMNQEKEDEEIQQCIRLAEQCGAT